MAIRAGVRTLLSLPSNVVAEGKSRWASLSGGVRNLTLLATILGCCFVGFEGLVIPCVVVYLAASAGLDADTIKWFKSMRSTYRKELKSDSPALAKDQPVVVSQQTATKFAILAQSRVGCLDATTANRLVYETCLLHIFDEYNVRHNIRLNLLGEALVACFIRPDTYTMARAVIDSLGEGESPLGNR
jgi:hypothetical protein